MIFHDRWLCISIISVLYNNVYIYIYIPLYLYAIENKVKGDNEVGFIFNIPDSISIIFLKTSYFFFVFADFTKQNGGLTQFNQQE